MSDFVPKKLSKESINNGQKLNNGYALNAQNVNDIIEGILYNNENSGSGGSVSVETDKTLSIENAPADAKAVGDELENKLDKFEPTANSTAYAYIAQRLGTGDIRQTQKRVGGGLITDAIPVYGAGGTLMVATPKAGTDATPKGYVDELVASKKLYKHYLDIKRESEIFTFELLMSNADEITYDTFETDMSIYLSSNICYSPTLDYYFLIGDFTKNQITLKSLYEADTTTETLNIEPKSEGNLCYIDNDLRVEL